MRRTRLAPWILSLLFALGAAPGPTPTDPPRFRVLLVGIGPYTGGRFGPLRGDKDVARIAEILETRWKVPEEQIRLLNTPSETTKSAILAAFRKHLVEPAQPGDVLYFGYAGHGTQIPDPSKPTGLSQAIVPIDVRLVARDDAKGNHVGDVDPDSLITGPEIGRLLDALRAKGVSNVTLTFDCCHSGSLTRGACRARGVSNPAVERFLSRSPTRSGQASSEQILEGPALQGVVCLSAARADQTAWEDSRGGFMTQALVGALGADRPSHTYGALFRDIQSRMAWAQVPARQDPQLEGPRERIVFGDAYSAEPPSVPVFLEEDGLVMHAGTSLGIQDGFVVGLYPPGTVTFGQPPPWTATVARAESTRALLKLSPESAKGLKRGLVDLNGASAVVLDGSPDGRLRVRASSLASDPQAAPLLETLRGIPTVAFTSGEDFDLAVVRPSAGGDWVLQNAAGKPVASFPSSTGSAEAAAQLAEAVRVQARKLAVARLGPSEAPRVALEMRFVRARVSDGRVVELGEELPPAAELGPSDRFAVKVRATAPAGSPMPYLTLLFVSPNARPPAGQHVGQIWPDPAESVRELRRIRPDGLWRYLGRNQDLVDGSVPGALLALYVDSKEDGVGPELFKLFATEEVVDFGVLTDPSRRGGTSRLGRLLEAYADNRPVSRRSDSGHPPAEWSVADEVVIVKGAPGARVNRAGYQRGLPVSTKGAQ
ncbi:MAG: caspase family protein [Fimbriimonadaceae bacterium]|nr:caspase family protein [Fimbriimonadaceae bacterium]